MDKGEVLEPSDPSASQKLSTWVYIWSFAVVPVTEAKRRISRKTAASTSHSWACLGGLESVFCKSHGQGKQPFPGET